MKMQLKILFISLLSLVNQISHAQSWTDVLDISTGVTNGSGSAISYGSPDDTWSVKKPGLSSPYLSAYVCNNINGAWATNNCGRWITPKLAADGVQPAGDAVPGNYIYVKLFQMDYHCMNWAKVNFSYIGGDNNVVGFYVNGYSYPLSLSSANDYNPLTQNILLI